MMLYIMAFIDNGTKMSHTSSFVVCASLYWTSQLWRHLCGTETWIIFSPLPPADVCVFVFVLTWHTPLFISCYFPCFCWTVCNWRVFVFKPMSLVWAYLLWLLMLLFLPFSFALHITLFFFLILHSLVYVCLVCVYVFMYVFDRIY